MSFIYLFFNLYAFILLTSTLVPGIGSDNVINDQCSTPFNLLSYIAAADFLLETESYIRGGSCGRLLIVDGSIVTRQI